MVTDRGEIAVEQVVIACGVWSPRLAAMAGASIPLTPAVHQMADMGPIDLLSKTGNEIGYPIVRDMDVFMYERQSDEAMEVGSYAHRPILVRPDDIPSLAEAARSPTEMPFTGDDFGPQLGHAREIMGELLAGSEMQYSVNGLLSLTPDTQQVLGETAEVEKLWSAAAVWIKEGPGTARLIAEWMTYGYPRLCDPARLGHHPLLCRTSVPSSTSASAATSTSTRPTGSCIRASNGRRNARHEPRAVSRPHRGPGRRVVRRAWLGAPAVVRVERRLGGALRCARPPARVGPALVVADQQRRAPEPAREGRHRRSERLPDLRRVRPRRGALPGASYGQSSCDRPAGSSIYTPLLTPDGGIRADLTIQRLAADRFRIVTGAFDGARDEVWFRRHLPADGTVQFENLASALCTIGVWGPDAPALLAGITDTGLSQAEFPYGTVREAIIDGVPVTMLRISYVGESGWEISTRMQHGVRLWDALWEAGGPFDARPVGIGVYGTTGRMEKGYLLMGSDLTAEYSPVEAGLARPRVKREDFIGKDAYLKARAAEPAARMCALTMDDHTGASGVARFPTGGNEPILTADGARIVDAHGRESRVTSAGMGPSVGKYLLFAYLPPEHAVAGAELQVLYMNQCFQVTVARGLALFDPGDSRMKA